MAPAARQENVKGVGNLGGVPYSGNNFGWREMLYGWKWAKHTCQHTEALQLFLVEVQRSGISPHGPMVVMGFLPSRKQCKSAHFLRFFARPSFIGLPFVFTPLFSAVSTIVGFADGPMCFPLGFVCGKAPQVVQGLPLSISFSE